MAQIRIWNPLPNAARRKFIAGAIHHPKRLTAAAHRAGMSIPAYARAHEHDPRGSIGDAARLYLHVLAPAAARRAGHNPEREEVSNLAHRKYHVRHHHHRRRNPLFGLSSGDGSRILWGSVGFVAARAVPAMALPSKNTGLIGYAMNIATAFILKFVFKGNTGDDMFVGGAVATVARVVSDQLGTKIQGLSGDPAYTLGAYWQSYFAVPTVSDPYGRVSASPYPAPVLPAAAAGGGGGMSGYARGGERSGGRFYGR
jgi:hypothetical protein